MIAKRLQDDGIRYQPPPGGSPGWLDERLDEPVAEQVRAFLVQLDGEGLLEHLADWSVVLPWTSAHHVIEEFKPGPVELPVPSVDERCVPGIVCRGNMIDTDFSMSVHRWYRRGEDGSRSELAGHVEFIGPATAPGTEPALAFTMSAKVYELWQALERFAHLERRERGRIANRQAFGEVRQLALACGAVVDAQFRNTFVLAPSDLWLTPGLAEEKRLEVNVTPTFEDAPEAWKKAFRGRQRVPSSGIYRFTGDHGEHVEVVLKEPVRQFLTAFRQRFPNGVARGEAARQVLSNPVALLGEHAAVLDVDRTEEAIGHLRRELWTFTPQVEPSDGRPIERVGLLLSPAHAESEQPPRLQWFLTPTRLRRFVADLRRGLEEGEAILEVFRCPVELSERDRATAERLGELADAWEEGRQATVAGGAVDDAPEDEESPRVLIDASWVFDLSRYGDRIEAIGVDLPFAIAQIPLSAGNRWLPEDAEYRVLLTLRDDDGSASGEVELSADDIAQLAARCADAEHHGDREIVLPGGQKLPIDEARALVEAIRPDAWPASYRRDGAAADDAESPEDEDTEPSPARRMGQSLRLLYTSNIDAREYVASPDLNVDHHPEREPDLPRSLREGVVLREHQKRGVAWLQALRARGPQRCRGALLADDMGLGKTLQLLTVIVRAHEDHPGAPPSLVIAPVSLLENWEREVGRFFEPDAVRVQRIHGSHASSHKAAPNEISPELRASGVTKLLRPGWRDERATIVLTTYETVRDYEYSLAPLDWSIIVCDEAQRIKNPNAMISRGVKRLKARFCIAATGTPVENNLTDLWSIFDFIQPGVLPALNEFNRLYRRPIEVRSARDEERLRELKDTIRPLMMRRTKEQVLDSLPRKLVDQSCLSIPMSELQVRRYKLAISEFYRAPTGRRGAEMRTLLARLRGICADPRIGDELASGQFPPLMEHRRVSPKLDWLITTLEQIRGLGEKAIVFTERKDLQRLLKHYIDQHFDLNVYIVNGDVRTDGDDSRQRRIDKFQEAPGFNVIILSQLAAGVGLNIQRANHVIHYTRHWNPAKEDQATDRAYRIGQERDVTVYTPTVVMNEGATFEQRLHALLEDKRALASDVLNGSDDISEAAMFNELERDLEQLEEGMVGATDVR